MDVDDIAESWEWTMDGNLLEEKTFTSGTTVFKAGDKPDFAYLISKGRVEILSKSGKILDTLERGDFFGEMALLDDTVRSATVVVLEDLTCALITREEIKESIENSDLLTYALVRMLTKRLRHTDAEIA